jgi:uncharacterized repeat protein (TIGR03803 family)
VWAAGAILILENRRTSKTTFFASSWLLAVHSGGPNDGDLMMTMFSARVRTPMTRLLEALESRMLLSTSTFNGGYSFTNGSAGGGPNAIVVDANGNVFGSTSTGGASGYGTFFGLGAAGVGVVSPAILGNLDQTDTAGLAPNLVVDSSDDVFGTSRTGGVASNGAIYEVSALSRTPAVLYSFPYGAGVSPNPTLTIDAAGDLFGTTISGGANGNGQVFEISAGNHQFTTVYSFISTDGTPGPVVVDAAGNIFGATTTGGANETGEIFEILAGKHTLIPLASLPAGAGTPSLAVDASDNLFGTTQTGGTTGSGTIFEYKAASQSLVTLYNFPGGAASSLPNPQIVVDAFDDVFGTTANGGEGTAFELAAGQTAPTILHTFADSSPTYGLVAGPTGILYGITSNGGSDGEGNLFSIAVNTAPPATHVVFTEEPASGGAGTLGTITVTVEDVNGDVVVADHSKVTLKIESGPTGDKISGTVSAMAVKGVATFKKAVLAGAGTYTLEAVDGTLTAAVSASFTLLPTAPTHLVFVQQPTTTMAGAAVGPALTVEVEDKNGNLVTTDASTVTLAVSAKPAGGAVASGPLSVAAVNGVASFAGLIFDLAGTYSLVASDGALKGVKSKAFAVNAQAATAHLVVTEATGPTAVAGNKLTALTVMLKDQFGNLVKGNKSSVVLSGASGPAGGKVAGTVSASISSGTATFKNVTVTTAGTYTLQVADAAVVNAFNVPLLFIETITPGVTSVAAIKPAKSYAAGATITLHTALKSTAASTIPYGGTATITDSSGDVLGSVVISAKGAVTATISDLAAGTYSCTLAYAGDVDHTAAQSAAFTLVVNPPKVTGA